MSPLYRTALLIVFAYLIGAIPFGVLVARARGLDIRSVGSGNIGATNVGRVLGKKFGLLVFGLDLLKGLLPTFFSGQLLQTMAAELHWSPPMRYLLWVAVGFATVIGHNFPVYLRFRGGKGVATSLGVTLGIYPDVTFPAFVAFGIWVLVVAASRYVSLASICAGIALPIAFATLSNARNDRWLVDAWPLLALTLLLAAMVVLRHRANLGRLLAGTESKIGSSNPRKGSPSPP